MYPPNRHTHESRARINIQKISFLATSGSYFRVSQNLNLLNKADLTCFAEYQAMPELQNNCGMKIKCLKLEKVNT